MFNNFTSKSIEKEKFANEIDAEFMDVETFNQLSSQKEANVQEIEVNEMMRLLNEYKSDYERLHQKFNFLQQCILIFNLTPL
jgi:hypothetical protein